MALNQYTPATTAYVKAAFKEYNYYVEGDTQRLKLAIQAAAKAVKEVQAAVDALGLSIADGAVNQTYEIGD